MGPLPKKLSEEMVSMARLSKQQIGARDAVLRWARKNMSGTPVHARHIHPTVYVLGKAAPGCLLVAAPWMDSEPHMIEWDKDNPLGTVHDFDKSLKAGDWCHVAYVFYGNSGGNVAVPIPTTTKQIAGKGPERASPKRRTRRK